MRRWHCMNIPNRCQLLKWSSVWGMFPLVIRSHSFPARPESCSCGPNRHENPELSNRWTRTRDHDSRWIHEEAIFPYDLPELHPHQTSVPPVQGTRNRMQPSFSSTLCPSTKILRYWRWTGTANLQMHLKVTLAHNQQRANNIYVGCFSTVGHKENKHVMMIYFFTSTQVVTLEKLGWHEEPSRFQWPHLTSSSTVGYRST